MKYRFVALMFCGSALLTACDNEVNLLEGGAPIPVVYGVFNGSVDEQQVSVTKTFGFQEGAGAREAARFADSVYYGSEDISVVAEVVGSGRSVVAERYNATDEGVIRELGVFADNPNVYYRYSAADLEVVPGEEVRLRVEQNDEAIATAVAPVLPELEFFASRLPPTNYTFTSENDFSFSWKGPSAGSDLATYEVGFVFAYLEERDGRTLARQLYWPAARELPSDNSAKFPANNFINFLTGKLGDEAGVERRFRYVQLVITGGDQNFTEFRALLQANAGITSTQELPPFSNVDGALGLFAGITQLRQDTIGKLSNDSFDALKAANIGF